MTKKPLKEFNNIKKWITDNYGHSCYQKGRTALGCIVCQIWQAVDVIEQALEITKEK